MILMLNILKILEALLKRDILIIAKSIVKRKFILLPEKGMRGLLQCFWPAVRMIVVAEVKDYERMPHGHKGLFDSLPRKGY